MAQWALIDSAAEDYAECDYLCLIWVVAFGIYALACMFALGLTFRAPRQRT